MNRLLLIILGTLARAASCFRPSVLRYHSVDSGPSKLSITPEQFAKQMEYLARAGFIVVSLAELVRRAGELSRARCVALTFDDGYQAVLTNALPVLAEYGYPATVFVVTHLLDQPMPGGDGLALISSTELNSMLNQPNVDIGAHTLTHPDLTSLDRSAAQREISGSRTELEAMIGLPVHSFCYPFGHYDIDIMAMVRDAGFSCACTTLAGSAFRLGNVFEICRLDIDRELSMREFAAQLTCATDWRVTLRRWVRQAIGSVRVPNRTI